MYGHYVMVTAEGKDKKGVRNNEKLAYLNYGTQKQQARPVISPAIKSSESDCLKIMQREIQRGDKVSVNEKNRTSDRRTIQRERVAVKMPT